MIPVWVGIICEISIGDVFSSSLPMDINTNRPRSRFPGSMELLTPSRVPIKQRDTLLGMDFGSRAKRLRLPCKSYGLIKIHDFELEHFGFSVRARVEGSIT